MTGLVITLLRTKDDAAALVAGIQELDGFKQLLSVLNTLSAVVIVNFCDYAN